MVFSKVSHTATETSVAALGPSGLHRRAAPRPAQVAQTNPPLRTEKQPGPTSELNGQESLGLMPGEYSRRRSADEYRVS